MTIQALRELVAAVQFRRDWVLTMAVEPRTSGWWAGGRPEVRVTVTALVENAYAAPGELPRVSKLRQDEVWTLDEVEQMDEGEAIERIWHFLRSADEHEAREWFRVRGVRVLDPHARGTGA